MTVETNVRSRDPVCGTPVEPSKQAGRADYESATYLFCSKHCVNTFNADPARRTRCRRRGGGAKS